MSWFQKTNEFMNQVSVLLLQSPTFTHTTYFASFNVKLCQCHCVANCLSSSPLLINPPFYFDRGMTRLTSCSWPHLYLTIYGHDLSSCICPLFSSYNTIGISTTIFLSTVPVKVYSLCTCLLHAKANSAKRPLKHKVASAFIERNVQGTRSTR